MYIQRNKSTAKSGKVYTSTLLCTKYRQDGKIKTKVEANLSKLSEELVLSIENILKHGKGALVADKDIVVEKSSDFGFAFLLIHLMDKLHISKALAKILPQIAPLLKAIIIGKIITRGSKLAIYNWLQRNNRVCQELGVDINNTTTDDFYSALGQASMMQKKIERKWFLYNKQKHNEVYLYDITSTYFEGKQNELAAFGYNRDKKKGKMQINIGLITNSEGFPLKIEVFKGIVNDHLTVTGQIKSIKEEFSTGQVVFVGDRGMKIRYNLEAMNQADKEGVNYITGLEYCEINQLVENGVLQLNMFSKEIAEVEHQQERYIFSVNPDLQRRELDYLEVIRACVDDEVAAVRTSWQERRTKNIENIEKLKNGHKNKKLVTQFSEKDIDKYKLRVEKVLIKRRMKKYYDIVEISNAKFELSYNQEKYLQARHLAGKYVICTGISKERMAKEEIRQQYKNLQNVEHAFRDLKSQHIQVRPVFLRKEAQTSGHILLSMFSYAIIKEMENKVFPFLVSWNKKAKKQLSFYDIQEELKDIKLVSLNLGSNVKSVKITELNELQAQILKLFQLKKQDIDAAV